MNILLTGASSFTGYWLARTLVDAGYRVVAPLRRTRAEYAAAGGARAERVRRLTEIAEIHEDCPVGSDAFLAVCAGERFALFCHHAAEVGNYKSPDFDRAAAVASNCFRLDAILPTLHAGGTRAMLLTGSVFEADRGAGTQPLVAFSPYAESKTRTAEIAADLCAAQGWRLRQFIIPNVFGTLQEPRFYDAVLRQWARRETATITAPDLVRDHMPVDLLARAYARYAAECIAGDAADSLLPSLYAERMDSFTERMAQEMRRRTGFPCEYRCAAQLPYTEPLERINIHPARTYVPEWNAERFWNDLASAYFPISE